MCVRQRTLGQHLTFPKTSRPVFRQASEFQGAFGMVQPTKKYFTEDRHCLSGENDAVVQNGTTSGLVAKWCQKEKIKTSAVALVVCLNIGVDPPGMLKISPCARKQCWIDPTRAGNPRALEAIGKNLQSQYERWQPRAKYKLALDPTADYVRKVCGTLRKAAKTERVLFHYNGHGVPRPTGKREIWVFNSQYTQYIPLSICNLQNWLGQPVIYVFDCPSAGSIVNSFKAVMDQGRSEQAPSSPASAFPMSVPVADPMKDFIILASCRANEDLPQDPEFPADLFTSCLTTPLKIALRWLLPRSIIHDKRITPELVDNIPGFPNDRKTPLGELNWIFTAITDTIAWNVLSRELFQKLFRQDLLVASLFRNFLLAERIMTSAGVTPISYPRLPPTFHHPMWQAWDLAAEQVLMQLPALLLEDSPQVFEPTTFFADQLDSFELWLSQGSCHKPPPRQLPIVLQVLLSPVHRLRALDLLYRFLELGTWAVNLALSVGIFPYVLKLLQTQTPELQETLISIWAKIMSLDTACQQDLIKDNGHQYFVRFLDSGAGSVALKAKAAFVLAVMCDKNSKGQLVCVESNVISVCARLLQLNMHSENVSDVWSLWKWLCICIGKLCENRPEGVIKALREAVPDLVSRLLHTADAEVRAAAIYALGAMILSEAPPLELQTREWLMIDSILSATLPMLCDGSPIVRAEIGGLLGRLAVKPGHEIFFQEATARVQEAASHQVRTLQRHLASGPTDASMHRTSGPGSTGNLQNSDVLRWAAAHAADYDSRSDDGTAPDAQGFGWAGDGHHGWAAPRGFEGTHILSQSGQMSGQQHGGGVTSGSWHQSVVEALCVIATDPAPQVAEVGRKVLHSLHWDLALAGTQKGRHKHSLSAPHLPSLFSGTSSIRLWKNSHSRGSEKSAATQSSTSSDQQERNRTAQMLQIRMELASRHCQRSPFRLKRMEEHVAVVGGSLNQILGSSHRMQNGGMETGGSSQPTVPDSMLFRVCREKIAKPQGNRVKRYGMHFGGDPGNLAVDQDDVSFLDIRRGDVHLNRDVTHVNTRLDAVGSVLMDPQKPLLAASGRDGTISIVDYARNDGVRSFRVTGESAASNHMPSIMADPRNMYSLNSKGLDMMMLCNADGSVYVLDGCTSLTKPRLVTAWQSVPVAIPPAYALQPVVYDWQPLTGELFASGGGESGVVYRMNLEYELQMQQFAVDMKSRQMVDVLRSYKHNPCLAALGTSDGMLRVFDVRTPHGHVAGMKPFPHPNMTSADPIAGLCVTVGGRQEKVAVISQAGGMKLVDLRFVGEDVRGAQLGVVKSVQGHSSGGASALDAHTRASVLASATLQPVIKVWDADAEQIGGIRPARPSLADFQGPVSCLSFHTSELKFAAGGKGPIVGIYELAKGVQIGEDSARTSRSSSSHGVIAEAGPSSV